MSGSRGRDRLGSLAASLHLWPLLRLPRRLNELVPHRARGSERPLSAYAVYRAANAPTVRRLIDGLPSGSAVHLHALDAAAPLLEPWTRSSGPGARMPLLQSLIDAHPPRPAEFVLVVDDDVVFRHSTPARFAALAATAGFDIAQPAHGVRSNRSFRFNRVSWLSTARRTRMVEIGPVVLLSPRAQAQVLPFPRSAGMGFGLDVEWAALRDRGMRLGVVDATAIRHLGVISSAYSLHEELVHLEAALEKAGISSVHDLDEPLGEPAWRPWQASPPWVS